MTILSSSPTTCVPWNHLFVSNTTEKKNKNKRVCEQAYSIGPLICDSFLDSPRIFTDTNPVNMPFSTISLDFTSAAGAC